MARRASTSKTPELDLSSLSGLEHLSLAVVGLNWRGKIVFANSAAEGLFATSAKKMSTRALTQFFPQAESLWRAARLALETNTPYCEYEVELVLPQGETKLVSCTVTPTEVPPVVLLLEFLPLEHPMRLAREERLLVEQDAARAMVMALAHEIKNPLGGIRGAAQLLEEELEAAHLTEYTQVIVKEANRLQSLAEHLASGFSAKPRFIPCNIHEALERVRALTLAESQGMISISRDYDPSLPEIFADGELLVQAFLNISRNAAQVLGKDGVIQLRTRSARQVVLGKKRHRLAVRVDIIDNGPGIPSHLQEKIFFPWVSGRQGGTGLGLAVTQAIVVQHQGTIEVESRPGYTRFTLHLPERPQESCEKS